METAEEIVVKIGADVDQLITEMKKAKGSIKDLQKQQDTASKTTSRASQAWNKYGTMIKGVIASAILYASKQMLQLAGKVDSVSRAFYSLTGTSREASDALKTAIAEASAGTVSNLEIMESANLALQLMGEQVAEHLPQMMRIARAAARATGKDVAQSFNDIIVAAGRQSVQVLDNLGISSAVASQKMSEYAASIGKTRQQLTDAEKKAAFFYAVMQSGQELIDRTGLSTLTLGERTMVLTAQWKNFKTAIAGEIIPALNLFTDTITSTASGTESLAQKIGRLLSIIIVGVSAAVDNINHLHKIVKAINADTTQRNSEIMGNLYRRYAEEARKRGDTEEQRRYLGYAQRMYEQAANSNQSIYEDRELVQFSNRAGEAIAVLRGLRTAADTASGGDGGRRGLKGLKGGLDDSTRSVEDQLKAIKKLRDQYLQFMQGSSDFSLITDNQAEIEINKLTEAYNQLINARDGAGQLLLRTDQIDAVNTQYEQQLQHIENRTSIFYTQLVGGMQSSIGTALSTIDAANRKLVYNMLWGEGGWEEFKKQSGEIMKQLVADILYAIARAAALQAILSATGLGGGGLLKGAAGKLLQKGGVPARDGENVRIPVFAGGYVPSDHMLSFISPNESVINARSTAANAALLKWINANPGQQASMGGDITVRVPIQLDGKVIGEVADKFSYNKARATGSRTRRY